MKIHSWRYLISQEHLFRFDSCFQSNKIRFLCVLNLIWQLNNATSAKTLYILPSTRYTNNMV